MLRLVLLVFVVVTASAFAAEPDVVDWRDAAQCVGRVCGIRGTVAVSENDGPSIRLYFDPERRDVRVLLMRGWLVTWPAYEGQTIIATGKVDRFRDHVEMILLDPRAIAVVGGLPSPTHSVAATATPSVAPPETPTAVPPETPTAVPPATPSVAPTAPPSVAPAQPGSEADELRQRVRELEQRVRELEER
jgi:hypothetical protein